MKTYTKAKLYCILEKHAKWLRLEDGGESANLRGANLSYANLSCANLSYADLSYANLRSADLSYADLSCANLSYADLSCANLRGANLRGANLRGANLSYADLRGAKNLTPLQSASLSIVPDTGAFEGWKKCRDGVLVRLLIPATARRSNATGRKCRAEFVEVLEVIGAKVGVSTHTATVKYVKGKTVKPDGWCEDRWNECAPGIHFFITRAEAEAYNT